MELALFELMANGPQDKPTVPFLSHGPADRIGTVNMTWNTLVPVHLDQTDPLKFVIVGDRKLGWGLAYVHGEKTYINPIFDINGKKYGKVWFMSKASRANLETINHWIGKYLPVAEPWSIEKDIMIVKPTKQPMIQFMGITDPNEGASKLIIRVF